MPGSLRDFPGILIFALTNLTYKIGKLIKADLLFIENLDPVFVHCQDHQPYSRYSPQPSKESGQVPEFQVLVDNDDVWPEGVDLFSERTFGTEVSVHQNQIILARENTFNPRTN
jgi:hypothetical protein